MFTPRFNKPLLALSAIFSVGLMYAVIVTALMAVSTWAERDLHAFPFKSEDWLRYLLPTRFQARERDRILLAGPSTVRENFRYELFEAAFPAYDIYQGGISLGTIDDITAALEYMEKAYGAEVLPRIIALGISPRFIANIPDERPFIIGLNLYSPYYSATQDPSGIVLSPKGPLESLLARARFLASKQPERFRTALLAVFNHWLSNGSSADGGESGLARALDGLLKSPVVARIVNLAGLSRVLDFTFMEVLRWRISPYKYSLNPQIHYNLVPPEDYKPELDGWWGQVYTWDPRTTEKETNRGLKNFYSFIKRHNIRLFVVNLPERDFSRNRFNETNYREYLDLVARAFPGVELVNLRDFLKTPEFYDREHSTTAGSIRLTGEVIRRIQATGLDLSAMR